MNERARICRSRCPSPVGPGRASFRCKDKEQLVNLCARLYTSWTSDENPKNGKKVKFYVGGQSYVSARVMVGFVTPGVMVMYEVLLKA